MTTRATQSLYSIRDPIDYAIQCGYSSPKRSLNGNRFDTRDMYQKNNLDDKSR